MADPLRQLARLIAEVEQIKRQIAAGSGFAAGHVSIEDAAIIEKDADGNTVSIIGKQWDGTHGAVTVGGPVPPAPDGLAVEAAPGGLTVTWAGTFADGAVAPMDFARVEVHASTDPAYMPDRDTVLVTFETPQGGRAFLPLPPDAPQHVRLITRATSGKASPPTAAVEATPLPVVDVEEIVDEVISRIPTGTGTTITYATIAPNVDGEVDGDTWYQVTPAGDLVLGSWRWDADADGDPPAPEWVEQKLTSQTIDSVTAGQIATGYLAAGVQVAAGDPAGARTELDAAGLRHYDAAGVEDVNLSSSGAVFSGRVVGAEVIGSEVRTATSGPRLELVPSADGGQINFYTASPLEVRPGSIYGETWELPSGYVSGAVEIAAPLYRDDPGKPRRLSSLHLSSEHPGGSDATRSRGYAWLEAPWIGIQTRGDQDDADWNDEVGRIDLVTEHRIVTSLEADEYLVPQGRPIPGWPQHLTRRIVVVVDEADRYRYVQNYQNLRQGAHPNYRKTITPARPLFVWRLDLPGPNKLEVTTDGVTWTPLARDTGWIDLPMPQIFETAGTPHFQGINQIRVLNGVAYWVMEVTALRSYSGTLVNLVTGDTRWRASSASNNVRFPFYDGGQGGWATARLFQGGQVNAYSTGPGNAGAVLYATGQWPVRDA